MCHYFITLITKYKLEIVQDSEKLKANRWMRTNDVLDDAILVTSPNNIDVRRCKIRWTSGKIFREKECKNASWNKCKLDTGVTLHDNNVFHAR